MEISESMPPTSGMQYHRAVVLHLSRHYLTHHKTVGDAVQAVNVPGPGEESEESSEMTQ